MIRVNDQALKTTDARTRVGSSGSIVALPEKCKVYGSIDFALYLYLLTHLENRSILSASNVVFKLTIII